MNLIQNTTEFALSIAKQYIRPNEIVIDATCGNGHDTVALAEAIWTDGEDKAAQLLAFDVQPQAIENTKKRLAGSGFSSQLEDGQIRLIQDNHANMTKYVQAQTNQSPAVCLIMFNLGYLPGSDKSITTSTESTLAAIRGGLDLLAKDGLLCITMYSGHDAGAKEKQALLAFAEELDSHAFHVAYINMLNQANNPPEILLISKKP